MGKKVYRPQKIKVYRAQSIGAFKQYYCKPAFLPMKVPSSIINGEFTVQVSKNMVRNDAVCVFCLYLLFVYIFFLFFFCSDVYILYVWAYTLWV